MGVLAPPPTPPIPPPMTIAPDDENASSPPRPREAESKGAWPWCCTDAPPALALRLRLSYIKDAVGGLAVDLGVVVVDPACPCP